MNIAMHHKNRGIVLAGVLIILVALTLVTLTVAQRNVMDEKMAANRRDALNAMTISESGIEAGFALVKHNYVQGQEMTDEIYELPGNVLSQDSVSAGSYLVTVIDGIPNDGKATLNSVGNFNGGVREIEIMLEMRHPGRAAHAILTNDDIISIDGGPEINGPFADVHSNSDVNIQGNPTVSGEVSASGNVNISGNPDLGAAVSGAALVEIPHVYPPEYKQYANVILTADCKVTSASNAEWADLSGGGQWHGWSCTPNDKWVLTSSNPAGGHYDGFYYVHGNLEISGGPQTGPWLASFVAEGYIDISGNAPMKPWASEWPNDTGDAVANDILFLAGNDLKIEGTVSAQFFGIMAAHMEVGVAGNATLNGSIMAENGLHSMGQEESNAHTVQNLIDTNYFTGNLTMTASGSGLNAVKQLTVLAWRELIH